MKLPSARIYPGEIYDIPKNKKIYPTYVMPTVSKYAGFFALSTARSAFTSIGVAIYIIS
jgi:hypothetical protein